MVKDARWRIVAVAVLVTGGLAVASVATAGSPNRQFTACLAKGTLSNVAIGNRPLRACPRGDRQIAWSERGPIGATGATGATGPQGTAGAVGATGAQGPAGARGMNGVNGSSFLSSAAAPSGSCTSGDTDLELDSGEVWSCVSGSWSDTGSSLRGPQGAPGPAGAPGISGSTEYTWTIDVPAGTGTAIQQAATSIPQDSTLTFVNGSLSIGTCSGGSGSASVTVYGDGPEYMAIWSSSGSPSHTYPQVTSNGPGGLTAFVACGGSGTTPVVTGSITFLVTPPPTTYS